MRKKKFVSQIDRILYQKITISDLSLLAFVNIYYTARKPIYLQYLIKKIFVPLHLTDDDILELTHWAKKIYAQCDAIFLYAKLIPTAYQ